VEVSAGRGRGARRRQRGARQQPTAANSSQQRVPGSGQRAACQFVFWTGGSPRTGTRSTHRAYNRGVLNCSGTRGGGRTCPKNPAQHAAAHAAAADRTAPLGKTGYPLRGTPLCLPRGGEPGEQCQRWRLRRARRPAPEPTPARAIRQRRPGGRTPSEPSPRGFSWGPQGTFPEGIHLRHCWQSKNPGAVGSSRHSTTGRVDQTLPVSLWKNLRRNNKNRHKQAKQNLV
jgi:hypothetical protein